MEKDTPRLTKAEIIKLRQERAAHHARMAALPPGEIPKNSTELAAAFQSKTVLPPQPVIDVPWMDPMHIAPTGRRLGHHVRRDPLPEWFS